MPCTLKPDSVHLRRAGEEREPGLLALRCPKLHNAASPCHDIWRCVFEPGLEQLRREGQRRAAHVLRLRGYTTSYSAAPYARYALWRMPHSNALWTGCCMLIVTRRSYPTYHRPYTIYRVPYKTLPRTMYRIPHTLYRELYHVPNDACIVLYILKDVPCLSGHLMYIVYYTLHDTDSIPYASCYMLDATQSTVCMQCETYSVACVRVWCAYTTVLGYTMLWYVLYN